MAASVPFSVITVSSLVITPAQGLGVPLFRSVGGYFFPRTAYDLAYSNLVIAIMTPVGSRPGMRSFGSNLRYLVFDPAAAGTLGADVDDIIRSAASAWVPSVNIIQTQTAVNGQSVAIAVAFALKQDSAIIANSSIVISKAADALQLAAA